MNSITFITAVIIALLSWSITFRLDRAKERRQKKIDLQAKYLIKTYYRLNKLRTYQQTISAKEALELLDECISETELFGTEKQISLVRELGKEFVDHSMLASLHPLINDIRDTLRDYIELPKERQDTHYFVVPNEQMDVQ
jgi:hypothetical protein